MAIRECSRCLRELPEWVARHWGGAWWHPICLEQTYAELEEVYHLNQGETNGTEQADTRDGSPGSAGS